MARRRRPLLYARRDERGATLVLCLAVICVLGVIVSATLSFQYTTYNAQRVVVSKRTIDLAADSAIDTTIGAMRYDEDQGPYENSRPSACRDAGAYAYDDPNLPTDIIVQCIPYADSGDERGTLGELPEHTILAMGGVKGSGYYGADTNIPFCDDHHTRDSRCEAAIFVGPGVRNPGLAGGLYVVGNGSGDDVVVSNGAIIARDETLDRTLTVDGGVWARRDCVNVLSTSLRCNQDPPDNSSAPPTYEPDPNWEHEWRRPFTAARHPLTNQPASNVSLPAQTPPATTACDDGYVEFTPGWYPSLRQLNEYMEECPETLYWFRPGPTAEESVYSFDFTDVGLANDEFWRSPVQYAQVIGGTPQGWNPCSGAVTTCLQPPKLMTPNRVVPDPDPNNWGIGVNSDDDYTDPGESRTDPFEAVDMDNEPARRTLHNRNTLMLSWDEFLTPMPPDSQIANMATANGTVMFRIRHSVTGAMSAGYPLLTFRALGQRCDVVLANDTNPATGDVYTDSDTLDTDGDGNPDDGAPGTDAGITVVDLSNGCPPASDGGVPTTNFPTSAGRWTGAALNDLDVNYEARRLNTDPPYPLVQVDGVGLIVKYTGRPSPSFPGGCDPANDGVQFVFGNQSRMRWKQNDVYLELCGGLHEPRKDDRAIAVYGLHHGQNVTWDAAPDVGPVPDSQRYFSGLQDTSWTQPATTPPTPAITARTRQSPPDIRNFVPAITWPPFPAPPPTVDWWEAAEDANYLDAPANTKPSYGMASWTDTSTAAMSFTLPTDAVPPGSVIEHAEVRMRHAEPEINGVSWVDTWQGASLKLKVFTTGVGDQSEPDGDGGTSSSPDFVMNPVRGPNLTGPYRINTPADFQTKPLADRWKRNSIAGQWTDAWRDGELLSSLHTAAAWNGARVELRYEGTGNGQKYAFLDAIEVVLDYRPPGEPRPLRGCMTIRTIDSVGSIWYGQTRDYRGIYEAQYGPPFVTSTDQSYGGGDGLQDTANCPLLVAESKTRNEGTKLHIAGALYAPTAALEVSGVDNEAPFVSDGIVVRHLSATRWREGPEIPAFGEENMREKDDRHVHLIATYNNEPVAEADVRLYDDGGAEYGRRVEVQSWVRKKHRS